MKFSREWNIWDVTVAVLTGLLAIVVFLQVVTRFILKVPMPWTEEVTRILFVYIVFLGAGLGMRSRGHVNVDFLVSKASGRLRLIWDSLVDIIVGVLLVAWVVLGLQFVFRSVDQVTPYLRLPISIMYFSIPLSAAIMLYYLIQDFVRRLRSPGQEGGE